jgi:hypothetical protein
MKTNHLWKPLYTFTDTTGKLVNIRYVKRCIEIFCSDPINGRYEQDLKAYYDKHYRRYHVMLDCNTFDDAYSGMSFPDRWNLVFRGIDISMRCYKANDDLNNVFVFSTEYK